MSIHLVCPLPLFWIARFKGWHPSRLTSTIRQMELKGARQRPGRPCQLIWPQAQPYSITTTAVNIQLRLVWVLLTVSFSRPLKMIVLLEAPCSAQVSWVHVPSTALHGQTGVRWQLGRTKLPPTQRLLHHRVVRESAWNSCHPSGCQADLTGFVGVPSFLTAPKVVQFTSITFPDKVECSYLSSSPCPSFALDPEGI